MAAPGDVNVDIGQGKTVKTIGHGHKEMMPSSIRFVRHRMYHARAALSSKGNVSFGLRHIRMLIFPTS